MFPDVYKLLRKYPYRFIFLGLLVFAVGLYFHDKRTREEEIARIEAEIKGSEETAFNASLFSDIPGRTDLHHSNPGLPY